MVQEESVNALPGGMLLYRVIRDRVRLQAGGRGMPK